MSDHAHAHCRDLGFQQITIDSGAPQLTNSAMRTHQKIDSVDGTASTVSDSSVSTPPFPGTATNSAQTAFETESLEAQLLAESNKPASATHCNNCAQSTVYASPKYDSKKRLLVVFLHGEGDVWSHSVVPRKRDKKQPVVGPMTTYLQKALASNYGVIVLNPAAQFCHPKTHVELAWEQLVVPLSSEISIIAFAKGSELVKHLLTYDNGYGVMQDRLKGLALVEPSHTVDESDSYFTRRMLARRAVAWTLSNEITVGSKIPKSEARLGCICISAGALPATASNSKDVWALEIVISAVFGSLAARSGEAAGVTVNEGRIRSCGICHRKLGLLNRRHQCSWCQVKYCSRCCEDKFVPTFGSWKVCSLCQSLPCLIDPRRKNKSAKKHTSPTSGGDIIERNSVFIQPSGVEDISLSDFEIIKLIGRGACGRVKLVRKKYGADVGGFYAMKAIKKKLMIQRGLVEATNAERRILNLIKHPFVTTLCYAFQNDAKLYLLSKYYPGGNLLDQMRLARQFPEDRVRLYAAEVALAINHLHQNNIIYRDLKLENVLVGSDGHIALTDFGLSKENKGDDDRTSTFVGTYQVLAPEMFLEKSYSRLVDWWALGILVYEMTAGRTPFIAKTNNGIKERITTSEPVFGEQFSANAKDFVARLLTKKESDRLGAGPDGFENIKNHPWFAGLDWDAVERKQVTFAGQDELKNSHAKVFSTADVFETYRNTVEMPVDTPTSVKSSTGELFADFEYSYHHAESSAAVSEAEIEDPAQRRRQETLLRLEEPEVVDEPPRASSHSHSHMKTPTGSETHHEGGLFSKLFK